MRSIALLGGTGAEGRGLALRFALAGVKIVIGSRDLPRADATARALSERLSRIGVAATIAAGSNLDAARSADIVCPVVPYRALPELLLEIAAHADGKHLLDVTNPVTRHGSELMVEALPAGSTAEWIHQLAPGAIVVSGFKNHSAEELGAIEQPVAGDVLFCSDHRDAVASFIALTQQIPKLRGIDAGPLRNARSLESMTVLLLNLNRRHRAITSFRILGLPD